MKITKVCKNCGAEFEADHREIDRNNAKFCSRQCGAIYSNAHRPYHLLICRACGKSFKSKAKQAKYCSRECAARNRFINKSGKTPKYRYHLNHTIDKLVGTDECFNCGWNKSICDVHHIISRKNDGTDDYENLIVVCPNCHRLIEKGLLDPTSIPTVSDRYRTMSLSDDQILDA